MNKQAVTPPDETGRLTGVLRSMAADAPLQLTVSGQCMEPILEDESRILVAASRCYWPGDILAFRAVTGELRVHRLIGYRRKRGQTLLQMRADASGTTDLPIGPGQIIGKVIGAPEPVSPTMSQRIEAIARFVRLRLREILGR